MKLTSNYFSYSTTFSVQPLSNFLSNYSLTYYPTTIQLSVQLLVLTFRLVLVTWSGKLWRSQRNFSLRTLRNLGFGKSKFEGRIHEEMKYMVEKMDATKDPIQIKRFLGPSVSNVIMLMTIGQRYDFDHPIRQKIDKLFLADRSNSFFNFYSIASHFTHTLKFLISLIPDFVIPEMKEFVAYLPNLLTRITNERMEMVEKMSEHELSGESDSFIDSYLKHFKLLNSSTDEENVEERKYFSEDNGRACAQAFFAAGSATTKDAIEWTLGLLAVHQDVQEEMFQEIDRVISQSRLASINDKNDFPVTESILSEVLRFASQVPVNIPHSWVLMTCWVSPLKIHVSGLLVTQN